MTAFTVLSNRRLFWQSPALALSVPALRLARDDDGLLTWAPLPPSASVCSLHEEPRLLI